MNRPLINDTPGQPSHPMTDEQYADYLKEQEEMSKNPPPALDPTEQKLAQIDTLVQALEAECKRGDQLQAQNEELYLYLAEKEYGAN